MCATGWDGTGRIQLPVYASELGHTPGTLGGEGRRHRGSLAGPSGPSRWSPSLLPSSGQHLPWGAFSDYHRPGQELLQLPGHPPITL